MAIGLMVLLLPYAGAFTVLPLAAVFFLDRGSRLLSRIPCLAAHHEAGAFPH